MKVLLIDDHPLFGDGFGHTLEAVRPSVRIRIERTVGDGLKAAEKDPNLDVVLVDYRLAGEDGLAGIVEFGKRFPLIARVLITGEDTRLLAQQARSMGAVGCLGKHHTADAILAALDRVVAGGECFDTAGPGPSVDTTLGAVTPRQLAVLSLIAMGRLNKQIADELGIAERTVKLHITALLHVFNAKNRTHLLVRAREHGLL